MNKYDYRGTINATALKPALLDPVDEILLVRVVSVHEKVIINEVKASCYDQ